jgi:membrane protease YdiL (CAAX protease family)
MNELTTPVSIEVVTEQLVAHPDNSSTRIRWVELILVLFVAFGHALAVSIYTVFTKTSLYSGSNVAALGFVGVIQELPPLLVLVYVLYRQKRTVRDLGLSFKWTDVPLSFGIAFCALVAEVIFWQFIALGSRAITGHVVDPNHRNVEFVSAGVTLWTFALIAINPFFEELIARAFLITELQTLTGSAVIAVVVSVLFQATYHLYQGLVPALLYSAIFLVFSLFYIKQGEFFRLFWRTFILI